MRVLLWVVDLAVASLFAMANAAIMLVGVQNSVFAGDADFLWCIGLALVPAVLWLQLGFTLGRTQ